MIVSQFLVAPVLGFAETSPFYSSKQLEGSFPYIAESSQLSKAFGSLTEDVCKNQGNLTVYRVSNLVHGTKESEGTYIKHVHYSSPEEIDFALGSSCGQDKVEYLLNTKPSSTDGLAVSIVDIEDDRKHTVDEFLTSGSGLVVVQGKPSFKALKLGRHHAKNKVDNGLNKRDDDGEFNKIMAEVEDEFKAAQSLMSKEGEDVMMTIMDSSETSLVQTTDAPKVKNPNLFTNYSFFSPGIWMCLLVSGFLLSILYITMSWMTSLEISYKAFDKQVDFEKKTE